VFESRELKRAIAPKMEKVVVGLRRLHNEELHNLHASTNIIRVIKYRMRWAEDVARIEKMINVLKERDHEEDLSVDGRIILEWILWN